MKDKEPTLLQSVGAGERTKNPEVWISALYETVKRFNPQYVVIPDLRHLNEAAFIKAMNGYCVKVTRLNADGTQYIDPSRDPNHVSEVQLDGFDGWDYSIVSTDAKVTERIALVTFRQIRAREIERRNARRRW